MLKIVCVSPVEAQEREEVAWQVRFEGNENFSNMMLRDIIATSSPSFTQKLLGRTDNYILRENDVRRDVIRIERYYHRRGYDLAEVDYRIETGNREWRKRVVFEISEGEPLRISDVSVDLISSAESEAVIRETREFDRAMRRHDFQPGNRYQTVRESDVEGLFMHAMQESGFAYASVQFDVDVDSLARQATVRIVNTPGSRQTFGPIDIIGDLSVEERIVVRETDIREGDIYSQDKIRRAQRELFNHHLFRFATVSMPDLAPPDSIINLTLRIREYPQRSVQTTVGFGREEYLRGQVTWQHRNVRSWGHRFSVTGRASFIEQRLGFDYLIPYVFNTRSSFVSSPYGQHRIEPAYELFRVGFSNSLIYQYSRNLTGSFSYELTINEELSRSAETALPDTVLNYNTASFVLSGYYNTSLSRPDQGWLIQPSVEISSLFNEGTYQYQKASLDVRRYTEINSTLVLAKRIQGGTIFTTETDSLPSTIRFYSGGTNSVRGWNRQTLGPKTTAFSEDGTFHSYIPIGGRAILNFNIEVRQSLNFFIRGFGVAAFLDGGQVWRSLTEVDERPVQFGAGGGLRYESPIGPVRVDIGYKLNPMDEDIQRFQGEDHGSGWDRIGIHFSIGQAF